MALRVKICGLSTETDLQAAIDSGADYIGLVHYPRSPRHVDPPRAAHLAAYLKHRAPAIASVVVLVEPDDALLKDIIDTVQPDYVQLHGEETPQRLREIRNTFPKLGIIKAIAVRNREDLVQAVQYQDVADMLLFDATPPPQPSPLQGEGALLPGGNGIAFDWELLSGQRFAFPWCLSGGLSPENVAQAIRITGARMVDVSSGVESKQGIKDSALIHAFIQAAKHET